MQEESLKADEVHCPGHSCERTFELTKTLICKWQILTRNSGRGSARVKKGKFIIRSKMIQPWLDLYNKAIQRDRQTHWFSFINICYAKSPSDLWNVCSHHCGYVSKSESFWTNRLVQSDYRLHTATPWYFYIRKYVYLQEKTRNWWRCEREPCTCEARKKQKVWLKKLKQLCAKKRHSSTKSFHEIPNSISPETLTVTHVGEKKAWASKLTWKKANRLQEKEESRWRTSSVWSVSPK